MTVCISDETRFTDSQAHTFCHPGGCTRPDLLHFLSWRLN